MKEDFRHTLINYGEDIKNRGKECPETGAEAEAADEELAGLLGKEADKNHSEPEVQQKIYELQAKKQEIMAKLRSDIRALDEPGRKWEKKESAPQVQYDRKSDRLYYRHKNKKQYLTRGELFTDGDWGLSYNPDNTVPRNIRKRYLIEEAKRQLSELADEQILLNEISSTDTHYKKKDAYQNILSDQEQAVTRPGLVAEKMVENHLKKLAFDHDVDFTIKRADVYQDVEQKLDFVIHIKPYRRGARVEDRDTDRSSGERDLNAAGIQFTTITGGKTLKHKESQVDRSKEQLAAGKNTPDRGSKVDDIILVSIPRQEIIDTYNQWQANQQPGGPDKLWDNDRKQTVFAKLMQDIMPEAKIKEHLQRIYGQTSH